MEFGRHGMVFGKLEETHDLKQVEWQIPDLPSLFSDSGSKFHQSRTFSFAGAKWHLKIYGLGNESSQGVVSARLFKDPSTSVCRVDCTMGIMKVDGHVEWSFDFCSHSFGAGVGRSDIFPFFNKADFVSRRSELVQSGVLTVVCILKIGEPPRVVSVPVLRDPKTLQNSATQTQSEHGMDVLSRHMGELMVSGGESDVTIKVEDEEFRLHRGILGARMEFFRSMFKHELQESATGVVTIDDCEADIFRTLVEYVYTGWVDELSPETVFKLYTLADKYQVDELKSICLEFIESALSADTFCDVATLALMHDNRHLHRKAADYFICNATDVMQTEKWVAFLDEHSEEANELLLQAVLNATKNNVEEQK